MIREHIFEFILLYCVSFSTFSVAKRPLNSFIRHHEQLRYDTSDVHTRTRRALKLSLFANVQIKFKAFNKNFTLHLGRNHDIFAPDFKIVDGDGKNIDYDYSRFYHGDVEGFHRSYCLGLIHNGRFQGSIHLSGAEYHIEPAERYYSDAETRDFHSIMYSTYDVDQSAVNIALADTPARPSNLNDSDSLTKQLHKEAGKKEYGKERYTRGTKNRHKNTCNLKLVADTHFVKKFHARETAIDEMVLHYKAVEYIFRNQTFNTTGELDSNFNPEGIGFRIKEVHVMQKGTIPKELKPKHLSLYRLLELFSTKYDHSVGCLSYLFTDRSFEHGVMGLAYKAYPYGQPGGICEPYADHGGTMKSFNTGVITFKLHNREAPRAITILAFAHELGHSFGANHDPPTKDCQPGATGNSSLGNFIMYDKATKGSLPNNRAFSKCSIGNMVPVINAKGLDVNVGCFTDRYRSICGNGAREPGEICDCGTVHNCEERCCTPYGSKKGRACTLANEAFECSPSRGSCCLNKTCTIAREFLKCFGGTECQKSVECDGLHYWCPKRRFKPDLTLCDKDKSVCIKGFCQGSLCLKYNLDGCYCEENKYKCKVCCNYNGKCTPSSEIPGMPSKPMSRGKPCNYYKGYCDAMGVCEDVDMDGPMRMLYYTFFTEEGIKIWFHQYWFVVILGSILILCMTSSFLYYCARFTKSDNPILHKHGLDNKYYKPFHRKKKLLPGNPGGAGGTAYSGGVSLKGYADDVRGIVQSYM